MKSFSDIKDSTEIQRRAAKVRKGWTALEKRRRLGLPPDVPRAMREFLLGGPAQFWTLAPYESR
jgi:hypothetical protein